MAKMPKTFPKKTTFEKWLSSLGPSFVVADNWGPEDCPLAKFLGDKYDVTNIYVCESSVHYDQDGERKKAELPEWAYDFIRSIDKLNTKIPSNDYKFPPVTAAYCRLILGLERDEVRELTEA